MPLRLLITLSTLGLALAAAVPAAAAPVEADRDGDGVFDNLESRLKEVRPSKDLRVLVSLSADATRQRTGRLEGEVGSLDVKDRFGVVDGFAAVVDARHVRELASEPGVEHVELDGVVRAANASAQSSFGVTEARADLPSLDGNGDGNATYSADDLVAAVIDTGIGTASPGGSHTNLDSGKVLTFQDFTEEPFDEAPDVPYDDNGHGTHVSGTIAGDGDGGAEGSRGVAPGAGLVGLKVLDAGGRGSSSDVIAAIDWVRAHGGPGEFGIEAINLSLGGEGCSSGTDLDSQAVNNASADGYVVAVAAGNDGPAACSQNTGISSPAAAANAITVGAMTDLAQSGFYLVGFSSRGPTLDGRTKPDIAAPGFNVSSADNATTGYVSLSGTSMSTPFVAGVALLMRDLNPALTPAQVKQRMMDTAIDWGVAGADNDYGAGRLDAYAAIGAAEAVNPPHDSLEPGDNGTALPAYEKETGTLAETGASTFYTVTADGGFPLTLGLTVGTASTDFDMYLYDTSGVEAAKAITPFRQDELHLSDADNDNGPYLLRIDSFSGSGSFALDVSGGSATLKAPPYPDKPVNDTPPSITGGSVVSGSTLTGDQGSWSGEGQISFRYEWERCNSDGSSCTDTGDSDLSHDVEEADLGQRLRLRVAATNAGGPTIARSALSAVVAPSNVAPPTVVGPRTDGETLIAEGTTWSGTQPVTQTFAWQRCAADGSACTAVSGATGQEYLLGPGDVGSRMRVVVTGTNGGGSASITSDQTDIVAGLPPANTQRPALGGSAVQGATLAGEDGTWSGTQPITFAYQWLRCNVAVTSCNPIDGATATSYQLRATDIGRRVRLRVTATNVAGTSSADSGVSGEVAVAPPAAPSNRVVPSLSGRARDGRTMRLSNGSWAGAKPIVFGFRWLRCDAAGLACRAISGATSSSYTLRSRDVGSRIRARVLASNGGGTAKADSLPTRTIRSARPEVRTRPQLRLDGTLLRTSRGRWRGTTPMKFDFQWLRCNMRGTRCREIRRATARSYRPQAVDEGHMLRARVTASNVAGTRAARTAWRAPARAARALTRS